MFCEDIKMDVTGQYHLIGCYAAGVISVRRFPAVLPKLAVWVEVQQTKGIPVEPLEVRGYLPGATADQPYFRSMVFDDGEQGIVSQPHLADLGLFPGERIHRAICASITSPVRVSEPGRIIVRGFIGDQYYAFGSIAVVAAEEADPADTPEPAG